MANVDVTRIAGNIGALNALNSLTYVNNQLSIYQTRLATGKRINESADDPSGMSLATTFDVRNQGLKTAVSAIGDAKNLMATMEGGLKKVQDILVKMNNATKQAMGDTIGTNERKAIQSQVQAFASEIDDIVKQTQWNSRGLLSASGGSGTGSTDKLTFLTGPEATSSTSDFQFKTGNYIQDAQGFQATNASASSATGLGLQSLTIDSTTTAATAAGKIETALNMVKEGISQVGAFTARLTFKEEALTVQQANTEAAYNRIMNANMAEEQVNAMKYQILQQTATSMLSQANMAPQFLLSLFK